MPETIKAVVRRRFSHDAFDWFDKLYFVDWAVVAFIWVLTWVVSSAPVFERDFSLQDPSISHPYKMDTVDSALNHWIALLVPTVLFVFGGILRKSLPVIHHGIISVCAARGLAELITEFMKHAVGRLRPDFLSRCHWDYTLGACSGRRQLSKIINGRKSFPSGHSSTAFSGMTVLSLWLAGQTAAWCFNAPSTNSPIRSRLLSFFLTLPPLYWATFVAVSRVEDNKHHPEDVFVGSLIGVMSAIICYRIFWPSPFSESHFKEDAFGQPRMMYKLEKWNDEQGPLYHMPRDDTEDV